MNNSSQSGLPTDNKPEFPCSPFFACGANHGIVIPNLQIQIEQPIQPKAKIISFFSERPPFISLASIWQPPKLA
jgi:hypothetical protein